MSGKNANVSKIKPIIHYEVYNRVNPKMTKIGVLNNNTASIKSAHAMSTWLFHILIS
jgi:hypothetical protein